MGVIATPIETGLKMASETESGKQDLFAQQHSACHFYFFNKFSFLSDS